MSARAIAVVTGASRGIGRAIAKRLAASYEVVALARTRHDLEELAREIAETGGRVRPVPCDVSNAADVERALTGVEADVLINNAGTGPLKPLLDLSLAEWDRMTAVNFSSLFYVTRVLLPGMIARRSGDIINIGSIAGRNTFVGGTCYAATKHAVNAFTESLMLEVRHSNVRVAVVSPGSVDTAFSTRHGDTSWMITPDEVADAVAYLLETSRRILVSRVEMRPSMPPKK
ncbi:MAG TPA: SDR family NAD(P)-dependent oxidoreductase [Gemmatimonadaceae bacterium]|nr:SDR family NAD(P)-dependent oxidoreductase [Gemmatimonadaceae bacterium]